MRFLFSFSKTFVLLVFAFVYMLSANSDMANVDNSVIAQITVGTAKVYEDMRPDAIMITKAYRGEVFDIKEVRDTWVKIATPRGDGWLYRGDCRTSASRDELGKGMSQTIYFLAVILLALIGAVVIFFKQKEKEEPFI